MLALKKDNNNVALIRDTLLVIYRIQICVYFIRCRLGISVDVVGQDQHRIYAGFRIKRTYSLFSLLVILDPVQLINNKVCFLNGVDMHRLSFDC